MNLPNFKGMHISNCQNIVFSKNWSSLISVALLETVLIAHFFKFNKFVQIRFTFSCFIWLSIGATSGATTKTMFSYEYSIRDLNFSTRESDIHRKLQIISNDFDILNFDIDLQVISWK